MTHICVGSLTIIGSDNGLSPARRQSIIWTNAGILLIVNWNFNWKSYIFIQENAFQNVTYQMAVILSRPQGVKKRIFSSPHSGVFGACNAQVPTKLLEILYSMRYPKFAILTGYFWLKYLRGHSAGKGMTNILCGGTAYKWLLQVFPPLRLFIDGACGSVWHLVRHWDITWIDYV